MYKAQESISNQSNLAVATQGGSFSAFNDKPLKLLIVSDLHLSYKNADKDSFNRFLDSVQSDTETTDLVLLGDIVNMWRRDASGVFLENWDVVQKMRIHGVTDSTVHNTFVELSGGKPRLSVFEGNEITERAK